MRRSIVLVFALALAACSSEPEELRNQYQDAQVTELICRTFSNGCCGDGLVHVECNTMPCDCPEGAVPPSACHADCGAPDAGGTIYCLQIFGACCSDVPEEFDCRPPGCACPSGYAHVGTCGACRPDAGG